MELSASCSQTAGRQKKKKRGGGKKEVRLLSFLHCSRERRGRKGKRGKKRWALLSPSSSVLPKVKGGVEKKRGGGGGVFFLQVLFSFFRLLAG